MKEVFWTVTLLVLFHSSAVGQKLLTRTQIEVYNFAVLFGSGTRELPGEALKTKFARLGGEVLEKCGDISRYPELVVVGSLQAVNKGDLAGSSTGIVNRWQGAHEVLEIIYGNMGTGEHSVEMASNVYLGECHEDLSRDTLTIHTKIDGTDYGENQDLHCALALYALSMDLKHHYPSMNNSEERQFCRNIIRTYLTEAFSRLPTDNDGAKNHEDSQADLRKAIMEELDWCQSEFNKK